MKEKRPKKQVNIRVDPELYDFLERYSKEQFKTITTIVKELIIEKFKEYSSPPLVRDK